MLSLSEKNQLVSRIFTDCNGRSFRLTFLVTIVDGQVRGRLVSAQPLGGTTKSQTPITNNQYCLPISIEAKTPNTEYVPAFAPLVSPYFSLEFLINSQPTRAPAFTR